MSVDDENQPDRPARAGRRYVVFFALMLLGCIWLGVEGVSGAWFTAVALVATYSPGAVVYTAASPDPVRGRAGIQQDTQQWITAMPDLSMEIEEVAIDGTTAAMRLLFVGTHTGPLRTPSGEIPPTGRRVSVPMAVFNRHDESGSTEVEHRYLDMMTMAQQLGIV